MSIHDDLYASVVDHSRSRALRRLVDAPDPDLPCASRLMLPSARPSHCISIANLRGSSQPAQDTSIESRVLEMAAESSFDGRIYPRSAVVRDHKVRYKAQAW